MKKRERLRGSDESPYKHDAVVVISNHELAVAVGEYVEKKYCVDALSVVFDMNRGTFGLSVADVAAHVEVASVEVKKPEGSGGSG